MRIEELEKRIIELKKEMDKDLTYNNIDEGYLWSMVESYKKTIDDLVKDIDSED